MWRGLGYFGCDQYWENVRSGLLLATSAQEVFELLIVAQRRGRLGGQAVELNQLAVALFVQRL